MDWCSFSKGLGDIFEQISVWLKQILFQMKKDQAWQNSDISPCPNMQISIYLSHSRFAPLSEDIHTTKCFKLSCLTELFLDINNELELHCYNL